MYAADLGDPGLTILDTTEIQDRTLDPEVPVVSHLTWDVVSIPQQPIPVTIDGGPAHERRPGRVGPGEARI